MDREYEILLEQKFQSNNLSHEERQTLYRLLLNLGELEKDKIFPNSSIEPENLLTAKIDKIDENIYKYSMEFVRDNEYMKINGICHKENDKKYNFDSKVLYTENIKYARLPISVINTFTFQNNSIKRTTLNENTRKKETKNIAYNEFESSFQKGITYEKDLEINL